MAGSRYRSESVQWQPGTAPLSSSSHSVLLVLLLVSCGPLYGFANPDAKRLYDDLLSNYNRLIRPVSNNTDTVLVKLGLRLSQLIDLVSCSNNPSRPTLTIFPLTNN